MSAQVIPALETFALIFICSNPQLFGAICLTSPSGEIVLIRYSATRPGISLIIYEAKSSENLETASNPEAD
jgi:hypothetical protein